MANASFLEMFFNTIEIERKNLARNIDQECDPELRLPFAWPLPAVGRGGGRS